MEERRENGNIGEENGLIRLPKLANLLYDEWFKRAFGTEKRKRLLLLLLREILPERKIQSIEYQQTEHINLFAGKADIRIDVECLSDDGSRFMVEVQRAAQIDFGDRMMYYSSFAIMQQLKKGHRSFRHPPVYVIALMNFDYHRKNAGKDEFMFRYMMNREGNPGDILSDGLQVILLELPRVTKEAAMDGTRLQRFCYYLSHMTQIEDIPEKTDDELFRMLYNSAETYNFTADERNKYIETMTTEQDIRNQIEFGRLEGLRDGRLEGLRDGRLEGREEGLKEGETKGMERAKAEIVKAMRSKGMDIKLISEVTGLSEEEVRKI